MKLYSLSLSSFTARVRLALAFKGLQVEILAPPEGGTRSEAFLAINPVGKIPVLITDDGLAIAESETIIAYLDDAYPIPSLMPSGVALRAQARNAVRIMECYVTPCLVRLFGQIPAETRDDAVVAAEFARMDEGLRLMALFVDPAKYAVGGAPSVADAMVLPTLQLVTIIGSLFNAGDPVGRHDVLSAYVEAARTDPVMGGLWDEVQAAIERATG